MKIINKRLDNKENLHPTCKLDHPKGFSQTNHKNLSGERKTTNHNDQKHKSRRKYIERTINTYDDLHRKASNKSILAFDAFQKQKNFKKQENTDKTKSKKSLPRSNEKKKSYITLKKPKNIDHLQKSRLKIQDTTKFYPKIHTDQGSTLNSNFSNTIELLQIQEDLKNIKTQIKKIACNQYIQNKQILQISDCYEMLIRKILFNKIMDSNYISRISISKNSYPNIEVNNDSKLSQTILSDSSNLSSAYLQQKMPANCKKKPSFQINLKNLKNNGIQEYQAEFMSHFEEMSESWKRDIEKQKKF